MLLKKIILASVLLATCAASAEELRCKVVGVARGADIPASQLDAARNFVAAYALEGEWLPAETSLQPGSTCTKSQARPVSDSRCRCGISSTLFASTCPSPPRYGCERLPF